MMTPEDRRARDLTVLATYDAKPGERIFVDSEGCAYVAVPASMLMPPPSATPKAGGPVVPSAWLPVIWPPVMVSVREATVAPAPSVVTRPSGWK